LRMSEDKVESQYPRLDEGQFVFAAIPQVIFADGGMNSARTDLKDEASARVSPGARMAQTEQLFY